MYRVVVEEFGGPDQLHVVEEIDPVPAAGEAVVRLTSIGMNHAELMQREGQYKLTSGEPPFTPGLEGGGRIEAIGAGVKDRTVGQLVSLGLEVPRRGTGTYRSHYLAPTEQTIPVPEGIDESIVGALWLPYLTAWGALIHQQGLRPGQTVLIPAASSSVGLAASQVVKEHGGIAIGTTTSPDKVEALRSMPEARFDHVVLTRNRDWYREVKELTEGRGCDVIFDPVAAGEFLDTEIRLLAEGGTIWVYGLLGEPGVVNVHRLIMKRGSIRGWRVGDLAQEGGALEQGYRHVLDRIANGTYALRVAETFPLRDVRQAHRAMQAGRHIGKIILVP